MSQGSHSVHVCLQSHIHAAYEMKTYVMARTFLPGHTSVSEYECKRICFQEPVPARSHAHYCHPIYQDSYVYACYQWSSSTANNKSLLKSVCACLFLTTLYISECTYDTGAQAIPGQSWHFKSERSLPLWKPNVCRSGMKDYAFVDVKGLHILLLCVLSARTYLRTCQNAYDWLHVHCA